MTDFCFVLCGFLPRCGTCCGLPLRVGALLVGIVTVVFKLIAIGTDICLIETTFMPPINSSASPFILQVEFTYLYVSLASDTIILLTAAILQCGVITANSAKVMLFILFFLLDWLRMLALFIYEVFIYLEKEDHLISGTLCDDLNEFYIRFCLILNLYFYFIVNSYYHKMVLRARSRSKRLSRISYTPPSPFLTPMFGPGSMPVPGQFGPGVYPLNSMYMQPKPPSPQMPPGYIPGMPMPMYSMSPSPHMPYNPQMYPMAQQQQMASPQMSPRMPHMQPMPKQQTPGQPMPRRQTPGQPMPKQQTPGQPMPRQQTPGQPMPRQQTPGQPMPKQQTPGRRRSQSLRPQVNPYVTMPQAGGYLPTMSTVVTPQVIPVGSAPSMTTSNYSSRTTVPSSYPSGGSLTG